MVQDKDSLIKQYQRLPKQRKTKFLFLAQQQQVMYSHLPGISASGDVVVALEDKFYALTQPLVSPPMSMTHFLFVVIAENGSYGVGHCVNYPGCVASQDLAHLQSTEEGGALERQCCCSPSTAQPKPWLLLPAAFQPPMQSTALPGLP